MGHPFKDLEVEALMNLLKPHFDRNQVIDLLNHAESQKVEYTGYGFFVSITNSCIGCERRVCDMPLLIGESDNKQVGFVAFLDNNRLTLEIFPFNGESIPEDFRERNVAFVSDVKTI